MRNADVCHFPSEKIGKTPHEADHASFGRLPLTRPRRQGRYLTSFNETEKRPRGPSFGFGDRGPSATSKSRRTPSHKTLSSESSTRLSLIRSSRMATQKNCAVSRSPARKRRPAPLARERPEPHAVLAPHSGIGPLAPRRIGEPQPLHQPHRSLTGSRSRCPGRRRQYGHWAP